VAEMLMSQLFGKSGPGAQSFPDSTSCQTEFMDIVGGDLNDGRQAGQQAKTPKHCQKKCQAGRLKHFFNEFFLPKKQTKKKEDLQLSDFSIPFCFFSGQSILIVFPLAHTHTSTINESNLRKTF
jgi:hypothetical protein